MRRTASDTPAATGRALTPKAWLPVVLTAGLAFLAGREGLEPETHLASAPPAKPPRIPPETTRERRGQAS